MSTKALKVAGNMIEVEVTAIEKGLTLLDDLRIQKIDPLTCIRTVGQSLSLTGQEARAIYAEWLRLRKPVF